jgi:hypothetical protein
LQFEMSLAGAVLLRRRQQHLVEVAGVDGIAERGGAIGVADDRLAQVEPGLAQAPDGALGPGQRVRPAGREVDVLAPLPRGQRRDQERVGGGPLASVAAQRCEQLRVLGGAGGDDQRLLGVLVLLHLGLLRGGGSNAPSRERSRTLPRLADQALKRG